MYIDPGSGGMLFQILAVLFGVISGTVLMFSGRIKMAISKFRRNLRKEQESEQPAEEKNDINQ